MPALWRGQALWQPLISLLKNKKGNRTPGRNYNLAGFEELKIMADVPRHKNEHKWNSSGAGQGEKSSGDHSYLGNYSKNHISHKHAFIFLQLQNEKKKTCLSFQIHPVRIIRGHQWWWYMNRRNFNLLISILTIIDTVSLPQPKPTTANLRCPSRKVLISKQSLFPDLP